MKASPFAELDTEARQTHAALEQRVQELISERPLKGFVAADEDEAAQGRYPWERPADRAVDDGESAV